MRLEALLGMRVIVEEDEDPRGDDEGVDHEGEAIREEKDVPEEGAGQGKGSVLPISLRKLMGTPMFQKIVLEMLQNPRIKVQSSRNNTKCLLHILAFRSN